MDERKMAELLNQQAEHLLAGGDPVTDLVAIAPLLDLARRLKAALVPVAPRPQFVAGLKMQLAAGARRRVPARRTHPGWYWLAGVGGFAYVAGLTFVSFRVARAGRSWVSGIMSARVARSALPEAQSAP
jgi:hypothetical protein